MDNRPNETINIADEIAYLRVTSAERLRFFAFEKYMKHHDGCRGGDQSCACGMAQVFCNLDNLLDSCAVFAAQSEKR